MTTLGGTLTLGDRTIQRMGYGAMQLAGRGVFGPPRDRDECIAVLREAVESGVDHIDTSDFYGPYVTNWLIREALHPYSDELTIVTKVGARRGDDGSWIHDLSPSFLVRSVQSNLDHLGVDTLDVVNLRLPSSSAAVEEPFTALAELQAQGLIRHLGLSEASTAQLAAAQAIAPVVCVQNLYNLVQRSDSQVLEATAAQGIPYVPYFPLGGFTPLQSAELEKVAASVGHSPQQVALAWLLQHSPNIVLIPGTSTRTHLRENLAAAALSLPADAVATLDALATP